MESEIKIIFKKIAGKKVNKDLLKENPNLPSVTKKTLKILCQQIEKYFSDNKIKVKASFILKNDRRRI